VDDGAICTCLPEGKCDELSYSWLSFGFSCSVRDRFKACLSSLADCELLCIDDDMSREACKADDCACHQSRKQIRFQFLGFAMLGQKLWKYCACSQAVQWIAA